MHLSSYYALLALGICSQVSVTLAGRGTQTGLGSPPAVCNSEPDGLTANTASSRSSSNRRRAAVRITTPASEDPIWPPDWKKRSSLVEKRAGVVTYDENCNTPLPPLSRYGPGFPTRKDVVAKAYADAVELANQASVILPTSSAFTNYFGTVPEHSSHFGRMMTEIADSVPFFHVKFECSGTGGGCADPEAKKSVAVTDGTAGDNKVINLCSLFFTSAQTRFFLYDKSKGNSPGVPYRDNTASGWCNPKSKSNFFATAGHTILHELTHLDALAKASGLEAPTNGDDAGRHGTGDYQTGCQLKGARDWKITWEADNDEPSPDYNAESYAAAATENYFLRLCGFTSIPK